MRFARLLVASLGMLLTAMGAYAGQDCGERPPSTPQATQRGLELGVRVRDDLEASGASMALVGRIGLNLAEFGQRYSHVGVALKDHVRNRWHLVHLFNPCNKGESELQQQPVEKFFETDLFEYEAMVLIPGYAKQARLRNVFLNPRTAGALHQPAYSLIAHPFKTDFQNSNQWILEMLALGLDDAAAVRDRATAQRWLIAQGFEPAGIRISNTRRSAARLFSPHVRFSDHSEEEYARQTYLVVTAESITRFIGQIDPQSKMKIIR